MNIEKQSLINTIIEQLEAELENALQSAETARLAAIDDQSVAETQYDTLGLEASYLAHGQSERAANLITQINAYKALPVKDFSIDDAAGSRCCSRFTKYNHQFDQLILYRAIRWWYEGIIR